MNVFNPLLARARSSLIGASLLGFYALVQLSVQAGTASYKYDKLGRLTEISYDTGVAMRYGYDAAGNRSTEFAYRPTLQIQYAGIDKTYASDAIYGKRLTITYDSSSRAVLSLGLAMTQTCLAWSPMC